MTQRHSLEVVAVYLSLGHGYPSYQHDFEEMVAPNFADMAETVHAECQYD